MFRPLDKRLSIAKLICENSQSMKKNLELSFSKLPRYVYSLTIEWLKISLLIVSVY